MIERAQRTIIDDMREAVFLLRSLQVPIQNSEREQIAEGIERLLSLYGSQRDMANNAIRELGGNPPE